MYTLLENDTEGVTLNVVKGLITIVVFYLLISSGPVHAFNEFQTFIEERSKKQLNCAYCHSHSNGPEGNEIGQLGSLDDGHKQLTAYNQFLQGNKESINSPILNEFGNYLVKKLGYEKLINAQSNPNVIVEDLKNSDLDRDGITDSQEILDGTLPNDPLDGNPFKLFVSNAKKRGIEICFQIVVILLLILSILKLKVNL